MEVPLSADAPLVEAVRRIESSRRRIAIVTEPGTGRLLGTLTDGDVRRCLLAGGSLETPVAKAMNSAPAFVRQGSPAASVLELMRERNVLAVPEVDEVGRLVRVIHLHDLAPEVATARESGFDFAVIMAGGEGMRLRPITESIPKPMVDIAGVPLLERQMRRLAKAGIRRAYIAVNYLGHVIEDHFRDGGRFGLEIRYLRESEKMGTAGALRLVPEAPSRPIVVMNGDIVTSFDLTSFGAFHGTQGASLTIAAVEHCVSIPYGVIVSSGPYVTNLVEKPSQRFLCNAGVYALGPDVFGHLPASSHFNMTDVISGRLQAGDRVAVFPVHEYWSDVGTPDDLDRTRRFFSESH